MPMALGFIGAGLSGGLAGFGAAGGMSAGLGAALLGTVIGVASGVGLYGLNLLMAGSGQTNMETPAGISMTDTGLRFDPTPNFTSSQASIPLVFGKTSVTCQIAHKRLYGDNYKKGYFFLACGEAPLELDKILIDDVPMAELSNYSSTPDADQSYYVWQNLGGRSTIDLDASSTLSWSASGNQWFANYDIYTQPGANNTATIAGPLVTIYGGGSIDVKIKLQQNKTEGHCWLRLKLENYFSPSEVYYSTNDLHWAVNTLTGGLSWIDYGNSNGWILVWLDATVAVQGGHIDTATEFVGTYTFSGLDPNTLWRVTLEYQICVPSGGEDDTLVILDDVVIHDAPTEEDFSCYGTSYALVHLVWHESLSNTPQFSAIVKGFGRESGQDEGNPALCAYALLTDREDPADDPWDIMMDRVEPQMVDWESVQETINFCNTLMGGDGYKFNRAFGSAMEKEAALKEMMAAGRFFIYCRGGVFYFKPDKHEPLTRIIDESSEIVPGSLKLSMKSYDTPNVMRASYYDEGLGYSVQTIPIQLDNEASRYKPDQIDLTGVTDQTQAYQLGLYALLARTTLLYSISINVRFATVLACYLGDLIQINTTHPIVMGKTWRIMAIPAELPGHIYTIQLTQHDPSIYTSQLNTVNEAGYVPYSPWYHLPIDTGSPSSWPGGNVGPSQVINLDITGIKYLDYPSMLTQISVEYEFLATNCDQCRIDYSVDIGQTWTNAGYAMANNYTFNVDLRWGVLIVRVAAMLDNVTGKYSYVQEYVEGLGGDDAGIGKAQIGWSPIGGSSL